MKLRQLALAVPLLAALALPASSVSAAVIYFGTPTVSGSDIKVDVMVGSLGGEIVSAYDLDVTYDTSALTFVDTVFSAQLGGPDDALEFSDGSQLGLVDFFSVSYLLDADLVALQRVSPVQLVTLDFTLKGSGTADSLAFANWGPFNDVKGANNRVIIGQVPEPASFGLVGLALLGALAPAALRRRKTN